MADDQPHPPAERGRSFASVPQINAKIARPKESENVGLLGMLVRPAGDARRRRADVRHLGTKPGGQFVVAEQFDEPPAIVRADRASTERSVRSVAAAGLLVAVSVLCLALVPTDRFARLLPGAQRGELVFYEEGLGATVAVRLPERYLVLGALLVYGVPLAALLGGAALAGLLFGSDLAAAAGAALTLALALLAAPALRTRLERATLRELTVQPLDEFSR